MKKYFSLVSRVSILLYGVEIILLMSIFVVIKLAHFAELVPWNWSCPYLQWYWLNIYLLLSEYFDIICMFITFWLIGTLDLDIKIYYYTSGNSCSISLCEVINIFGYMFHQDLFIYPFSKISVFQGLDGDFLYEKVCLVFVGLSQFSIMVLHPVRVSFQRCWIWVGFY